MPRFLADVRMNAIHAAAVASDTGNVLDAGARLDTLAHPAAGPARFSYFN